MAFRRHPSEFAKLVQAAKGEACINAKRWYAMRVLRSFTVGDVLAVTETDNRSTTIGYLNKLTRAGFLAAKRGNRGAREETTYRLVRNSGPQCPAIIRHGKAVWDFNLNKEFPIQ